MLKDSKNNYLIQKTGNQLFMLDLLFNSVPLTLAASTLVRKLNLLSSL
jgi:hypothetical protein